MKLLTLVNVHPHFEFIIWCFYEFSVTSPIVATTMGRTLMTSSKSISEFFYERTDDHLWECKKCRKTKAKSGGWTNLLSHLRSCVGHDYEDQYKEHKKVTATTKNAAGFFILVSDREREVSKWIEFIVMKNLPVSFVDCPYTRDVTRLKNISSRTLRSYILALLSVVKETIQAELPSKFPLVFDGWSEGSTHYIGVAAAYIRTDQNGNDVPVQTMLSMKPLLAEGIKGMRASDHLEHIEKVLGMYGKTFDNVLCLVGDNCSVNQSMGRILGVPLIGCASHKFNLAVRQWISGQAELTPIIRKVS